MANVERTDNIINYDEMKTLEWTRIDLDYERKLQGRSQLFVFWDFAPKGGGQSKFLAEIAAIFRRNPGNLAIFL